MKARAPDLSCGQAEPEGGEGGTRTRQNAPKRFDRGACASGLRRRSLLGPNFTAEIFPAGKEADENPTKA